MFFSMVTSKGIDQKSNDIANEARITGNDRFSIKNFFYALNHYNRSIAFARSKYLASLAYGNRSAAYFELQLYKECLENIQLARDNGYPASKMAKLDERGAKCKELMHKSKDKKTDELWDFFKLSYPANEKIPFVVDCVEMKWTEKYGRGIYAKKDLKAGDVICVEDAFFNYTNKDVIYNTYLHCYNCYKSKRMNLIHCSKIASIMFCSTACKEDFYSKMIDINKVHEVEYKLLSDIAGHFGSVKAFDDYINRTDLKTLDKTIFDYDLSNPEDPDYKDKLMNCFLSLSSNKVRSKAPSCLKDHVSKKTSDHLLNIYDLNQRELRFDDGEFNITKIGSYISLFSSLVNHSCINNAFTINVGSKVVTFLEKPVKAGEQIFYRYGKSGHFFLTYRWEKGDLEEKFNFKCDCEICTEPNASKRQKFSEEVKLGGKNDKETSENDPIHEGNYEKAREKLKKYFNEMNINPVKDRVASPPLIRSNTILLSAAYMLNYSIPTHFTLSRDNFMINVIGKK